MSPNLDDDDDWWPLLWVILVGPVFGGRCGAEALGLGLGLSPGPAYRFALPPGLAAKTTRCLVFDQGRPTSHLHCHNCHIFDPFGVARARFVRYCICFLRVFKLWSQKGLNDETGLARDVGVRFLSKGLMVIEFFSSMQMQGAMYNWVSAPLCGYFSLSIRVNANERENTSEFVWNENLFLTYTVIEYYRERRVEWKHN